MNFDIDVAIVVGFITIIIIIGLLSSNKVNTLNSYAIGDRNFSTFAITATLIATWISGGSFSFYMAETYSQGLYFIIAIIADACSFLMIAYVFVPKTEMFLGKLSIAEVMGDLYGKNIRIITSITGFIGTIGALAIQFRIFSSILEHFLNIPTVYSVIFSSSVVILYSTFGGIKSVTFTDIIQILTFSIVIPVLGFAMWATIDDTEILLDLINTNPNFNVHSVFDYTNPKFFGALAIFLYFLVPGFSPATFQRISMSKNIEQAKKAFIWAGYGLLIIELLIAWIAVLVLIQNPNIEPYNILNYIIDNNSQSWLKGMIIIGVMAMIMSTADSYITSSAVLFSHDFCEPLGLVSNKNKLLFSKIFCLVIGSIAIFFSIKINNLLSLFILGYGPYMTIITVPFMLSVLGFKTTKKPIIIGMTFGLITSMLWKYLSPYEVDDTVLGMGANLIALLVSHYWFYKPNKQYTKKSLNFNIVKSLFYKNFKFDLTTIYIKSAPKQEYYYPLVSFFFFISIFSTVYSMPHYARIEYNILIENIYYSTLCISSVFLTYPLWSKTLEKQTYLTIFWIIGLTYNLVFIPNLLAIISGFNQIHLIILIIDLVILAILLPWKISILSIIFGTFSSMQLYIYLYQDINFTQIKFKIIYLLVLLGAILIAFFKPKQEEQEKTEAKVDTLEEEVADLSEKVVHYSERVEDQSKEIDRLGATAQRILNNVNHELRLPVGNVMNFAEMLNSGLGKFNDEQLKMLSDEVYQNSNRLSSMIMNMLDLATLEAKKIELNKSTINFGELVRDRVQLCRKMYLGDKKIDFEMQIEEDVLVKVDPNYMRQTMDNLVINAINFSTEGVIRISVLRKGKGVEFIISDNGIGIPKEDLYDIFTPFKMGSNAESKAKGRGVGLALCKAAVEAHGGYILAESSEKGAVFRFVL